MKDPTVGKILHLVAAHPEQEMLILLAGLSLSWLQPQSPIASSLLKRYREREYSRAALREAALQLFLLAGFQASLEAAFQIYEVFGAGLPAEDGELSRLNVEEWLQRGYALQAQVYRDNVEKLRGNLKAISPELETWTVLVGYGMVMTRPGMSPHWRELLEIGVLAAQGFPRQLHSHFRGALNLGASPQEIELILTVADFFTSEERSRSAWQMWRRIQ
jgi:4-carboxymuconolactone decarboxylase